VTYGFSGLKRALVTAVVTALASAAEMRPARKSRSVRKSVSRNSSLPGAGIEPLSGFASVFIGRCAFKVPLHRDI